MAVADGARRPASNAGSVEARASTTSGVGPTPGRPRPGPGRPHGGEPGAHRRARRTAGPRPRSPVESRAARSSVTSTRSVASRSPTTARRRRAGSSGTGGRRRTGHAVPSRPMTSRADRRAGGASRQVVRDFAERGDRPPRRGSGTATTRSRSTSVRAMGELGPVRHPVPGGVRRRRRRPHHAVRGHRGAGPGRPVDGHHPRGRRRPRAPTRSTGSAPRSSASGGCPDLVAGRALGGFGLTEPDAGSDAGGTRTRADARRRDRRVGDRRREGVHHQLGHAITSIVTVTAVTGSVGGRARDQHDRGAGRHAGLRGAARRTARWAGTPRTRTA